MLVKWTLVAFGIAAIVLFVLSKILAFMNPPRPERPRPPLLGRVERALRWTVIVPFALAVVLLVLALTGSPMTLAEKVDQVPDRPGVYLYKDAKAQVIYVGKAASLKSRVRSYFQESRARDPKTDALVGQIRDLDVIVTGNELEALILESHARQAAPAALQHHPARRQALPVPQAHHRRGVPAARRRPARAEGRRRLLRPLLSGHRHAPDPAARAPALPAPHLSDQDRRLAAAAVPAVLHPPLQGAVHRVGDARGLRGDGAGGRAIPRGQGRHARHGAHAGDGGGRGRPQVRAGRRAPGPDPGAQHGARAAEDDLDRGGGPGHRGDRPSGRRCLRAALLRAQGTAARPRVLLLRAARGLDAARRPRQPSSASSTRRTSRRPRRSSCRRSCPRAS